ncbi:MAG TPA: aminoglycoside phosphotransferase family protein, partial [Armatimonadota bacterium]|nr:aminoglycoside phosphotransferase family protein [Armatimonadota bacterium]
ADIRREAGTSARVSTQAVNRLLGALAPAPPAPVTEEAPRTIKVTPADPAAVPDEPADILLRDE